MADIPTLVATAIRDADKSWFNEDYSKQAYAVLKALREAGYVICPAEVPEALVPFAIDNMPFGRMKPEDMIAQLYDLLVRNARKFE